MSQLYNFQVALVSFCFPNGCSSFALFVQPIVIIKRFARLSSFDTKTSSDVHSFIDLQIWMRYFVTISQGYRIVSLNFQQFRTEPFSLLLSIDRYWYCVPSAHMYHYFVSLDFMSRTIFWIVFLSLHCILNCLREHKEGNENVTKLLPEMKRYLSTMFLFWIKIASFVFIKIVNENDWMKTIETIDERAKSVDTIVLKKGIIII